MSNTLVRLSMTTILVSLLSTGCLRPYPDMRVTSDMQVNAVEEDGFKILNPTITYGSFPSGIAVARVRPIQVGWHEAPDADGYIDDVDTPSPMDMTTEPNDSGQAIPGMLATLIPGIPVAFDFFPLGELPRSRTGPRCSKAHPKSARSCCCMKKACVKIGLTYRIWSAPRRS